MLKKIIFALEQEYLKKYFSALELEKMGIKLDQGSKVQIERTVQISIAPGKTLILKGNCKIEGSALIILDQNATRDEYVIENSRIETNTRIWNASISHTHCQRGSQVIAPQKGALAEIRVSDSLAGQLRPDDHLMILGAGDSYQETNFAQFRGGVFKRARYQFDSWHVIKIPSGHSLISRKEYDNVRESNKQQVQRNIVPVAKDLGENVLVKSGYCHFQDFDTIFDPDLFKGISYRTNAVFKSSADSAVFTEKNKMYIDLSRSLKSKDDQQLTQVIRYIKELTANNQTLIVKLKENGYMIVTRNEQSDYQKIIIAAQGPQVLLAPDKIGEIREKLADYIDNNHIDFKNCGVRLVLDIQDGQTVLYLGHQALAPQNPHDWLAAPNLAWKPAAQKAGFFLFNDEAVAQGLDKMKFGKKLEYLDADRSRRHVYAVEDGAPKSPVHYIILANGLETTPGGNFMDPKFPADHWQDLFRLAYQIYEKHDQGKYQQLRLVSNMGMGLQAGPVAHMHIQLDTRLASLFPQDYGIPAGDDLTIELSEEDKKRFIELLKSYQPENGRGKSQEELTRELLRFKSGPAVRLPDGR
ncbi:MAG: hypothetical protein WC838_04885 [Candidatus Margulisiibacteriota bacterium]|jgi:hypothetical protein